MSKRYRSQAEAIRVRIEACRLAAQLLEREELDKNRLWATCVFFETYIARGSSKTRRWMDIEAPKRRKSAVVQLITRDD